MHGFMNVKFTHGYLATLKVHRLCAFQAKVTRHLFHLERAVTLFSAFYHFSFLVVTSVLIRNQGVGLYLIRSKQRIPRVNLLIYFLCC